MAEKKFEELLSELEKTVKDLEKSDITLEDAIKKYQLGLELAAKCNETLSLAEKAIVTEEE
jgi:exodeoxyribonuclease VII small subunit